MPLQQTQPPDAVTARDTSQQHTPWFLAQRVPCAAHTTPSPANTEAHTTAHPKLHPRISQPGYQPTTHSRSAAKATLKQMAKVQTWAVCWCSTHARSGSTTTNRSPLSPSFKMIWASCSPPRAAPQQLACHSELSKHTSKMLSTPCAQRLAIQRGGTGRCRACPKRGRVEGPTPSPEHGMRQAHGDSLPSLRALQQLAARGRPEACCRARPCIHTYVLYMHMCTLWHLHATKAATCYRLYSNNITCWTDQTHPTAKSNNFHNLLPVDYSKQARQTTRYCTEPQTKPKGASQRPKPFATTATACSEQAFTLQAGDHTPANLCWLPSRPQRHTQRKLKLSAHLCSQPHVVQNEDDNHQLKVGTTSCSGGSRTAAPAKDKEIS